MNEIRIHKWRFRLPKSRPLRIALGILLVILGFFGFLPILGFWMIPLGLAILSYEIPLVRRWRRIAVVRFTRWWERRKSARQRGNERGMRERTTDNECPPPTPPPGGNAT